MMDKKDRVLVAVDVSGSMSIPYIEKAVREQIKAMVPHNNACVLEFDDRNLRLSDENVFLASPPFQGCASDPNCIFHEGLIKFVDPKLIIVFTDGYSYSPVIKPAWLTVPVVWVNVCGTEACTNWGTNIGLNVQPPKDPVVFRRIVVCKGCEHFKRNKNRTVKCSLTYETPGSLMNLKFMTCPPNCPHILSGCKRA